MKSTDYTNYLQSSVLVKNIANRAFQQGINNYVVARAYMGELWYYGAYKSEERALEVAKELENGVVLIVEKG